MMVETMKCPNCGAPVGNDSICEYCGTEFMRRGENNIAYGNGVCTLRSQVIIPDSARYYRSDEEIMTAVGEQMRKDFMKNISKFVSLKRMDDPCNCRIVFVGEIRVVPIDYRFRRNGYVES